MSFIFNIFGFVSLIILKKEMSRNSSEQIDSISEYPIIMILFLIPIIILLALVKLIKELIIIIIIFYVIAAFIDFYFIPEQYDMGYVEDNLFAENNLKERLIKNDNRNQ